MHPLLRYPPLVILGLCVLLAPVSRSPGQAGAKVPDPDPEIERKSFTVADGFEVLRAARDANPSVYVVMITGYASIDSAVRAVREGAYDYLAKPFALGQLEVVLTRIKDRMALEQENRELTKLVGGRDAAAGNADLGWRLQAIEERLAHIEALLRTRG